MKGRIEGEFECGGEFECEGEFECGDHRLAPLRLVGIFARDFILSEIRASMSYSSKNINSHPKSAQSSPP